MRVIYAPEVVEYIDDLVPLLYEKGYFSFAENARKYVDDVYDDITANLPNRLHKRAPNRYARYGKDLHYATFRKNKQTTWYAFFTKYYDENQQVIYLIRYIGNNHTEAQFL